MLSVCPCRPRDSMLAVCIRAFHQARAHLDRAIALYDPAAHRPLATRFGQDVLVITLLRRSMALWTLGYPDAAVADTDRALSDAREIGHAATLLVAFIAPI